VPLIQAVHNLEHGGIDIEWGNKVPPAEIAKIRQFYDPSPNAMLAFPLPKLGNKIALVAWTQKPGESRGQGRIAECTRFRSARVQGVPRRFRGKGPERFPLPSYDPAADDHT
jgi:hypothetical protein